MPCSNTKRIIGIDDIGEMKKAPLKKKFFKIKCKLVNLKISVKLVIEICPKANKYWY